MIYRCATCGKEFDALWPDLYRYKRGGTFLCSWGCLRKYEGEKGSDFMARMKKDGTPAKRPGPKPKEKVELVYDESIAEEYRREQAEKKANEEARTVENVMEIVGETSDGILIAPKKEKEVVFKTTWSVDGYAATAIKRTGSGSSILTSGAGPSTGGTNTARRSACCRRTGRGWRRKSRRC